MRFKARKAAGLNVIRWLFSVQTVGVFLTKNGKLPFFCLKGCIDCAESQTIDALLEN